MPRNRQPKYSAFLLVLSVDPDDFLVFRRGLRNKKYCYLFTAAMCPPNLHSSSAEVLITPFYSCCAFKISLRVSLCFH